MASKFYLQYIPTYIIYIYRYVYIYIYIYTLIRLRARIFTCMKLGPSDSQNSLERGKRNLRVIPLPLLSSTVCSLFQPLFRCWGQRLDKGIRSNPQICGQAVPRLFCVCLCARARCQESRWEGAMEDSSYRLLLSFSYDVSFAMHVAVCACICVFSRTLAWKRFGKKMIFMTVAYMHTFSANAISVKVILLVVRSIWCEVNDGGNCEGPEAVWSGGLIRM